MESRAESHGVIPMTGRITLTVILSAGLPAGFLLAGDITPPTAQKVPHMQTLHDETLKDDYF